MNLKAFVLCLLAAALAGEPVFAKTLVGWVDRVKVYPGAIALRARMDTGADGSSLRVSSMHQFERDAKPWLRVEITDRRGHLHTLEAPVVRHIRIKRHTGEPGRRPVIELGVCVGTVYKDVQASVTDRGRLNYPLLIGRNFLAGDFLIDSAETYSLEPACAQAPR